MREQEFGAPAIAAPLGRAVIDFPNRVPHTGLDMPILRLPATHHVCPLSQKPQR
jgi:hypothetical protein